MINFNRISPPADFYSKIQSLDIMLGIVNKNILYVTHECDKILKLVKALEHSGNLQKQVDEYFDEDDEDVKELTSLQTELDNKLD